ncbi:MAG TPA: hypothetical protein PLB73_17100, partial [Leptospiraceae bacterium]|nr:hypothetical protein [Leptospiraceae bacterium]
SSARKPTPAQMVSTIGSSVLLLKSEVQNLLQPTSHFLTCGCSVLKYEGHVSLVLLIDADPNQVSKFEHAMQGSEVRLLTASNLARGLELAKSGSPDLIMVGATEKSTDSISVISNLRKEHTTREIGICLISAPLEKGLILRLKQLAVLDIVPPSMQAADLRGRVERAVAVAEKLRLQQELKRANHINVSRKGGRTQVTVLSNLKDFALPEAKVVFNHFFLKLIKPDIVILDIRQVPEIPPTELRILDQFVTVLGGEKVLVLAGKHLGSIVSQTEIGSRNKVFFSSEEMDTFLARKK